MSKAIMLLELALNDIISFNTYGTGAINNVVNGVYLGSYIGLALRNPGVAATNHANVYPAIPVNPILPVPNNYTKYNYLLIRLADNSLVEIGIPWIIPVSLTRQDRKQAIIVLKDFDPDQLSSLNELLDVNGYLNRTITIQ